ncbi:MAG: hypothetical protein V8S58_07260 [Lachnospiraceae bacterium]
MRKIHCLNAISKYGTDLFTEDYELTDEVNEADGILVSSASMHEMQFPNSLLAVARAGAGVNNIPLDACAQEGIVVFNTPGANANGVKELVIAGLILASRDMWAASTGARRMPRRRKSSLNRRKQESLCRLRDQGQEAGRHRPGSHRCGGCQCGHPSAWRSTATTRISPSTPPGDCPGM